MGRTGAGWAPTAGDAVAHFALEPLEDGRTRCQFCGRGFMNNRIHEHSHICGQLRQARPACVSGVRTQLPARVYNSAAARTTFQGSFERQRQALFISRAAAESQGVLVRCAGVARKIGSKAAATIRPWTVLGVTRHASSGEIKAAYHRLAKEWHPDRQPTERKAEAEARFKSINESYEAMTRPKRRARPGGRKQLALVAPENWRAKHEELVHAARCARGGAPARGALSSSRSAPDHRTECPHCKRRFGQVQAERHIPKCAGVVNKPRPPPGRSPPMGKSPASPERPTGQSHARPPGPKPEICRGLFASGAASSAELAKGMSVCIEGLSSAAHLNGTVGVISSFDQKTGRWRVELPGDGAEVAVRADNLKLQPRNGSLGPVKASRHRTPSASKSGARYDWMDRPPSQNSSNGAGFEVGSKVRLDGLVGAAHLNGMSGVIHHFDDTTLRWHVELPGGETKAVRAENLEALVRGSPVSLGPKRHGARTLGPQDWGQHKEPGGYSLPAVGKMSRTGQQWS